MPGPAVTLGCAVVVSPGAAGPPDSGVIVMILQTFVTAGGMPLAVSGSICQMVNSVSGVPYPLPIGPGGSTGATTNGQGLVRMGDMTPPARGIMTIIAPPASPAVMDTGA